MVVIKDFIGKSINANLFRRGKNVIGKIHFGENGVVFKSNKVDTSECETEIKYKDIDSLNKRDILGVVPTGVEVVLKNGTRYRFTINSRDKIIEFLDYKKSN